MPSPTCLARHAAARWLLALAIGLVSMAPASGGAQGPRAVVTMPAAGTPLRKSVLDAVRRHLRSTAVFKVAHLAVSGSTAFLRAGEVVPDGENLQETDLFVEVLLDRGTDGRWRVLHLWNLATEGEKAPHDAFLVRVRRVLHERALPVTMLPEDLRPDPGA